MKIEANSERQTLSLKQRIHGPQPGEFMFGRKKKDNDVGGVACPYCGVNNPLGSEQCEQCYYSLNKSARDQPMAKPSSTNDEIMSLLLGDNEEEEDTGPVVEAVLSLDDVTVEVDQYSITETEHDEEGEPVPESFEFIGSQGPTLSSTVASQEPAEVELTAADAPKTYVEFDLGNVDPLAEVAEPVHTGRGGLYSPTVEAPKDDDLLGEVGPAPNATPDLPDLASQAPPQGASLAQAMATETPDLPDFLDETPAAPNPTASPSQTADVAASVPDQYFLFLIIVLSGKFNVSTDTSITPAVDEISLTTSGTFKFTVLLSQSTLSASASKSVLTTKSIRCPGIVWSLLILTSPVAKVLKASDLQVSVTALPVNAPPFEPIYQLDSANSL